MKESHVKHRELMAEQREDKRMRKRMRMIFHKVRKMPCTLYK